MHAKNDLFNLSGKVVIVTGAGSVFLEMETIILNYFLA